MASSRKNPEVDRYFSRAKNWRKEQEALRTILLACYLTEELKWNKPCYALNGSNVIIMLPKKEHCALLFCKGVLVDDPQGILIQPGEQTQAARQMRFVNLQEIVQMKTIIASYIEKAIEVEKAGLEVVYKKSSDFIVPEELQRKLDGSAKLKAAFGSLTPGRQRGYIIHFSAPKQSRTRESRVEKCIPRILQGKGMMDR